jgi:sulfate permease, SulP family
VHRLVREGGPDLRAVVVDASGVNDIDTSALDAFTELVVDLAEDGIAVHLATAKGPVRDVLTRAGTYQQLGDRVHAEVHDAVLALTSSPHGDTPPGVPTETGLDTRPETRS